MLVLVVSGFSFLVALILTPLCRNLFTRAGLVDRPDGGRRQHRQPIPRLGGIPIVIAWGCSVLLLNGSIIAPFATLNWGLIPALAMIFGTGLADDIWGLKPLEKLFGQISAAAMAYAGGVQIHGFAGSSAPWLSFVVTLLWLIGCTNAFNLIDGVDGLASGVGLFATITILLAGLLQHNMPLVFATAPLAGALIGFLRYNFSPASIFLGDCGSLFIGFILGCYGVTWSQKSATLLGMTAPLMALAIPLLDTGLAIVRRFLRGQPILNGDRNHIHHRLLDQGLSPRMVALVLYAGCGVAAIFSLLESTTQSRYSGLIIIVFCTAAWIGVQHLGYTEFGTARQLLAHGTFRRILDTQVSMNTFEKRLKNAHSVQECWTVIREAGKQYGFTEVRLQLDGEIFDERIKDVNGNPCWTMRIPLAGEQYVNLTHECEPTRESIMVLSPLAGILQRSLSGRAAPGNPPPHPKNGNNGKSAMAAHTG